MASNRISTKNVIIGIVVGAILGLIGLLMIFFPNEYECDFLSAIIYAVIAAIVFVILVIQSRKQTIPGSLWIASLIFGILFPICIPFAFIALDKLQGYSAAEIYTAPGGSNGGNYSSGNYSGTESGVIPRGGSRFGGGGAAVSSEPEVTEDAFGQSKSSSAPASGGPRFGRTTMDEPSRSVERGLHDRIADLDSDETITITLQDGREFSFNTLAIIPLDDDVYAVVEAAKELDDIPVGMIGVFKFIWGDNGEELVISVDDQKTIDRVEAEFQKLIDAENGSN